MTFTYFISSKSGVKIGTAADPLNRLTQLQIGNADELQLIGVMLGDHERLLHDRFVGLWIRGEWFHHDQALHDFIKENCLSPEQAGIIPAKCHLATTTLLPVEHPYVAPTDREARTAIAKIIADAAMRKLKSRPSSLNRAAPSHTPAPC